MIQARLAAPRRAALVTSLVLAAAMVRAVLLPLGDLLSTAVFAACLLGIARFRSNSPARSSSPRDEGGPVRGGIVLGLFVGALLVLPNTFGPVAARPLTVFWGWAAVAAVVATLEETAIRGALYHHWSEEGGPVVAIVVGAVVFALIHLPRYGFAAMPLDLAVGVVLGGLRAITGRVLPCAVAHTIADWGAWFWA